MISSNTRKQAATGSLMVPPVQPPAQSSHLQDQHVTSSGVKEVTGSGTKIVEDSGELLSSKEKTPMCLVNELARHNKIEHQYRLTGEEGPAHKKRFTVTLRLGGEEYSADGASIKKAQHAAASVALSHTAYRHPPPKSSRQHHKPGKGNITPTVELNALAMKRGEPTVYTVVEVPPTPPHYNYNYHHRGMYTQPYNEQYGGYQQYSGANSRGRHNYRGSHNQPNRNQRYGGGGGGEGWNNKGYKVKVKVGEREFVGEGATSQAARHDAASRALDLLKELPPPPANPLPLQCDAAGEGEVGSSSELKSPISLVHEMALKRNLSVSFDVLSEKGPPHMRTFLTRCTVGDLTATAEGNGKKVSKKRAAEKMLDQLRRLPPLAVTAATCNPSRLKRKGTQNKKKPRNLIKETTSSGTTNTGGTKSGESKEERGGEGGEATGTTDNSDEMNPISRLIQIQQAKKEKEPVYTLKEERGAPRRREFLIQVSVGDVSYVGSGPNKKVAKRAAAEGLLQVLGYSSSTVDSQGGDLTAQPQTGSSQTSSAGGAKGRQIVPGLLLMKSSGSGSQQGSGVSLQATAAVAKEYLNSKESEVIRPTEQLDYLSQVLHFKIQYTDFRKGSQNEFLSLVSLSTDPPQVCHGSGPNTDLSKDQAALNALKSLAEMGLDSITSNKKSSESLSTLPSNITINPSALNTSSATQEMYLSLGKEDGYLNGK